MEQHQLPVPPAYVLSRNPLNNLLVRKVLVLSLLFVLAALLVLKIWQVGIQHSLEFQHAISCGICRRVDDVSWWSCVALFLAAICVYVGTSRPPVMIGHRTVVAWVVSSTLGVAGYLYGVSRPSNPGTFWHPDGGVVWWIQRLEGVLALCNHLRALPAVSHDRRPAHVAKGN